MVDASTINIVVKRSAYIAVIQRGAGGARFIAKDANISREKRADMTTIAPAGVTLLAIVGAFDASAISNVVSINAGKADVKFGVH